MYTKILVYKIKLEEVISGVKDSTFNKYWYTINHAKCWQYTYL
jgi:hypothetical protein